MNKKIKASEIMTSAKNVYSDFLNSQFLESLICNSYCGKASVTDKTMGTLRFDYEYEIECGYDFSNLVGGVVWMTASQTH